MAGSKTSRRERRAARQIGLALVSVLWGLTLLALIAAAFLDSARTGTTLARYRVAHLAAEAAAEAGVHRATLALAASRLNADDSIYAWDFRGAEVRLAAVSESAKIDLNRTDTGLIAGLFEAAGAAPDRAAALADQVADFRDPDHLVRANGAEDDAYDAAGRTYDAKDAPFRTVAELRQVLDMTTELFEIVAPHVTVHGERSPDPAVATPLAAAALGESRASPEAPPLEPTAGDLRLLRAGYGVRATGPGTYTVHAEATTADGGFFAREAVVRVAASGRFRILAWRQGRRLLQPEPH